MSRNITKSTHKSEFKSEFKTLCMVFTGALGGSFGMIKAMQVIDKEEVYDPIKGHFYSKNSVFYNFG